MFKFRILIPFLALLLIGISSCQSSQNISKEDSSSPCNDKLYVALQSRDSSTYTKFEKDYFRQKRDECINGISKKAHAENQAVGEKVVLGVAIAGGVLLGVLLILVLSGGLKQ